MALANASMAEYLVNLKQQCLDEKRHYEDRGIEASLQKQNRWALYTRSDRIQQCFAHSKAFIRQYPECRFNVLPKQYLRALTLLQHHIAEDTADLCLPPERRRHCDVFEGVKTDGVNSQLVKDAHRSEWTVGDESFSMQQNRASRSQSQCSGGDGLEDRKAAIAAFQHDLVVAVEEYILSYCERRDLTGPVVPQLMQCVTTQMSQAGLANLEQSSQACKVFVSGEGLQQRTTYNLATLMDSAKGEVLKLSILCMKTGFTSYITPDGPPPGLDCGDDWEGTGGVGPFHCSDTSYLYQYATMIFFVADSKDGHQKENEDAERGQISTRHAPHIFSGNNDKKRERKGDGEGPVRCTVIDLLDELHILPMDPL
eukprot:CAMPEP_0206420436 /NCGR_PEP_ID=MMETSP0324_2-20121206/841_1 /ASSEMBLY_ACC=CAM_ASM_000836 /TAXON_ID=2866 /ORGANISM="Crypthecodinium cohnii, Strain Seligo" /LENGTH=368 /DNA_ID=CAMNT_0053884319 /DNA_START=164 /DNA_END=1270 /DNA_ORIENTATION=+